MPRPLNIAYLSDMSPLDRNLYSGGNARMYDALCQHAGTVTILPTGWGRAEPVRRLIEAMPLSVTLRARWRAHLALSRVIARDVQKALMAGRYDVLFCAYALHALRGVTPPRPVVTAFASDATQTVYRRSEIGQSFGASYPGGRLLDGWVTRCEAEALAKVDLALWPSGWLCQGAERTYALRPGVSHLVPWGANIGPVPPPAPRTLAQGAPLRLLLIGRDWYAKGGPLAFETMQALRAAGVDARLCVIGCVPPDRHVNQWVTIHPQLDKSIPAELAQFNASLAQAHFLVQPSYESYGFAFCEASAHGLPSLCLRVGGVPVRDRVNGFALSPDSGADDFARVIKAQMADPAGYAKLCETARREYETTLNWDAWGKHVSNLLSEKVARNAPRT